MSDRRVDAIAGPPDATRPRNPWPRLLLFFLVAAAAIGFVGYCTVSFVSPPPREIRVSVDEIAAGLPRFEPVTTFGADEEGRTYGAWVTFDGERAAAYLARNPETLCRPLWDASHPTGEERPGAFVDPCGEAHHSFTGMVVDGSAPRALDVFPTRIEDRTIVVDITRLTLGECEREDAVACSPPGAAETIDVPRNALGPGFATE